PDGKIEINPTIHKIMKVFGAETKVEPGKSPQVGQAKKEAGIPFDVQPVPVEGPRRMISTDYGRTADLPQPTSEIARTTDAGRRIARILPAGWPMTLLVLGTHNRKKAAELIDLLASPALELRTLADYPQALTVEETGDTFAANAELKAAEQARHLKTW